MQKKCIFKLATLNPFKIAIYIWNHLANLLLPSKHIMITGENIVVKQQAHSVPTVCELNCTLESLTLVKFVKTRCKKSRNIFGI